MSLFEKELQKNFRARVEDGTKGVELNPEAKSYIVEVAAHHLSDLASNLRGFFSREDQAAISQRAADDFIKRLKAYKGEISFSVMRDQWAQVVQDFHERDRWGFKVQSRKSEEDIKAEKKETEVSRELLSYIWTFFQAAIIMKIIVLYFGINSAIDQEGTYKYYLALAIAVSISTLLFFAWRKSRKGPK